MSFMRKVLSLRVIVLLGFFATTGTFAQQPLLTITSPGSGTLLQEGQTFISRRSLGFLYDPLEFV